MLGIHFFSNDEAHVAQNTRTLGYDLGCRCVGCKVGQVFLVIVDQVLGKAVLVSIEVVMIESEELSVSLGVIIQLGYLGCNFSEVPHGLLQKV